MTGVGLGKAVAVGETAGGGDTTSGVDVAGGVGALVGGKLTSGKVAGEIGVPVGGTLAIGAALHAATKHISKTAPTHPSRHLLTGLHSSFNIRHSSLDIRHSSKRAGQNNVSDLQRRWIGGLNRRGRASHLGQMLGDVDVSHRPLPV